MKTTITSKQDSRRVSNGTLFHAATFTNDKGTDFEVGIEEMVTNGSSVYAITWLGDEPFSDTEEQEVIEEAVLKALEASPLVDDEA